MEKVINGLETCFIVLGSALGLSNIENILGIILLIVQFGLVIFKIVLYLKNGDVDKAIEVVEDIAEEITKKEDTKDGQ